MPKKESELNSEENNLPETASATRQSTVSAEKYDALEELVRRLLTGEQIPSLGINKKFAGFAEENSDKEKEEQLKRDLNERLTGVARIPNPRGEEFIKPISVAFPECSDVLLSLINSTVTNDEITAYFNDYFKFCDHSVIAPEVELEKILDKRLLDCTGKWFPNVKTTDCGETSTISNPTNTFQVKFPPFWCLPPSCVKLAGNRHLYDVKDTAQGSIRRLFIADLVWLFYFDRLGIFKILGAILDDYATKGRLPISNGSVNANLNNKGLDDLIALVLESMVRKTKIGLSSTVRDRNTSYRRGIGWILDEGKSLGLDTVVNKAFTNLFHKFIQTTLEFYKDKRLATAIVGINSPSNKTSVATLISIKDTIGLLKKAFDPFDYGRNYSNTLHGIVWAIAGMALIRELRTTLGIPPEYDKPYEYIPAAYDILIKQSQITPSESNRYNLHRDCANNARDILLDLEVVNHEAIESGGELELWINLIEGKVEGYRTAYRSLTGTDLGSSENAVVEQLA